MIKVEKIGIYRFRTLAKIFDMNEEETEILLSDWEVELCIKEGLDIRSADSYDLVGFLDSYGWIKAFEDALKNGVVTSDKFTLVDYAIKEILIWYLKNRVINNEDS